MKEQKKTKSLPVSKALLMIALSVCLVFGSSLLLLFYYKQMKEKRSSDPAYEIVAVVQTSLDAEGLKTAYLTELLELSIDHPKNLFSFNSKEAREKLLKVPYIKDVTVEKIHPGTIHVDYTLRKPIAFLADYTNTVIDAEKVLLPFKPLFTPKKLPEIYTGVTDLSPVWGSVLTGQEIDLAFTLLNLAPYYCDDLSTINRIDVSHAFSESDGKRQIVIILEDRTTRVIGMESLLCIYPRILRLCPDNYREQLSNYTNLRTYLRKQECAVIPSDHGKVHQAKALIVDLRLSDLAFFVKEP